jgi:hypothetical protein
MKLPKKLPANGRIRTSTLEITLWQSETFLMKKSLNIAIEGKFLTEFFRVYLSIEMKFDWNLRKDLIVSVDVAN